MISCRRLLLVLAAALAPGLRAATFTAAARAGWAENISRTSNPADAKDSGFGELTLSAGWHRQLSRNWQAQLSADVAASAEFDFPALDTRRAGAALQLRRKFGLGPMAPVLGLDFGLHRAAVRESGRSRLEAEAGLALAKRLSAAWRLAGGLDWTEHYARHDAFDVRHHRIHAEASWDLTPVWRLEFGGSRQWGQLTANASWPTWTRARAGDSGTRIAAYYGTLAWEESGTYGPRWVAYRIDARADTVWAGISPALGARVSLPLRYERTVVVNRADVRYVTEIWSLGVLYRF